MISVIGIGGVSGPLVHALMQARIDTTVVVRPERLEHVRHDGLTLRNVDGQSTVYPQVALEPVPGSRVIVAVKAYSLADVLPEVVAAAPTEVLFLQNGVAHQELVHAAFGETAACGSIRIVAHREPSGLVVQNSSYCQIEVPDRIAQWRLFQALQAAGAEITTGGTEDQVLWRKLRFLAVLALTTSWKDKGFGLARKEDPAAFHAMVEETAALAAHAGLPTDPRELIGFMESLPDDTPSSLWLDVQRGGPTELDALGTHLVELGHRWGIAVPTLTQAVDAIGARLAAAPQ